jgi:hypothetical protein
MSAESPRENARRNAKKQSRGHYVISHALGGLDIPANVDQGAIISKGAPMRRSQPARNYTVGFVGRRTGFSPCLNREFGVWVLWAWGTRSGEKCRSSRKAPG